MKKKNKRVKFNTSNIEKYSYEIPENKPKATLHGYTNESLENNKICVLDDKVDVIIRKSMLSDANVCKPKKKLSRNDIEKNRENVFGFRDYVFQNSNEEDIVDRINELYANGNSDITKNNQGMKVRDVFDNITKGSTIYNKYKNF